MTGISVPLLSPLSESLFSLDTKLGSSPEGQIVTSIHQNVTFQRALRGLACLGLYSLKETCVTQSRDWVDISTKGSPLGWPVCLSSTIQPLPCENGINNGSCGRYNPFALPAHRIFPGLCEDVPHSHSSVCPGVPSR